MAKNLLEHVLSASSFASPQGYGPILRLMTVLSLTGRVGGSHFPSPGLSFPFSTQ